MKRNHLSPTLLVLVYILFVVAGTVRFFTEGLGFLQSAGLVLNVIVLSALLLVAGSWAREVGVFASWLNIGLGCVVMAGGVISLLSLNIAAALFVIVIGAVNAGVGLWTIVVLRAIDKEARMALAEQSRSDQWLQRDAALEKTSATRFHGPPQHTHRYSGCGLHR